MNSELYDRIMGAFEAVETRLDRIEALIATRKPGRRAAAVDPRTDLTRQRVEIIETVFWKIVNSSRGKKIHSYRVPTALIGARDEPNIEAVVASVLCNQASLRKAFRTAGLGDGAKETPLDRARRALAVSNLVVLPMGRLRIGDSLSPTDVALSPGEARRLARVTADLPEPVGWTTAERAMGFEGPTGRVEPPLDMCRRRVWPGEDAGETVDPDDDPVDSDDHVPLPPPAPKLPRITIADLTDDDDDLLEDERKLLDEQPSEDEPRKPLSIKVKIGPKNK